MLRVMEARKAAHAAGTGEVVLEFLDGDLKTTVGPDGAYQPVWGVLKASAGNITLITKMVCRRKDAPDQAPVKVFHLTNGLTLAEFNDLFRFDAQGMDLPKLPVFGGYEVVLTMTTDALADISWVTKGYNRASGTGLRGWLNANPNANPNGGAPPVGQDLNLQPGNAGQTTYGHSVAQPAVFGISTALGAQGL